MVDDAQIEEQGRERGGSMWDNILAIGREIGVVSAPQEHDASKKSLENEVNVNEHGDDRNGASFDHPMDKINAVTNNVDDTSSSKCRTDSTADLDLEEYIVCKGETINSLALKFDMSVRQLKRVNQLFSDSLFKGQKLMVASTLHKSSDAESNVESRGSPEPLIKPANSFLKCKTQACIGSRKISGHLFMNNYSVMFEPSETDANVKNFGLMEFQFCIDIRDIKGCGAVAHVADTKERMGGLGNVCDGDNSLFDQSSMVQNDLQDKTSDKAVEKKTFLQIVWSSEYTGCSHDCVIYFIVTQSQIEQLVDHIQLMIVRERELTSQTTDIAMAARVRPTLTSGKPLLSGGVFQTSPLHNMYLQSSCDSLKSEPCEKVSSNETSAIKEDLDEKTESKSDNEAVVRLPQILPSTSTILTNNQLLHIEASLPDRCRGFDWKRIYDFTHDGVSLSTFYQKLEPYADTITVIRTTENDVLGFFSSTQFTASTPRQFYGNGELFLFSFHPTFQKHEWTGENEFFVSSSSSHLGFGGGGSGFSLMLDGELNFGSTGDSETFSNTRPFTKNESFQVAEIESYAFQFHQHLEGEQSFHTHLNSLSYMLSESQKDL